MALPQTVRVKLSSEAAEAISITPVVVQELPIRELVEHMLGVTGKDEARIREFLLRGSLVSGASRFRWAGWEADAEALREVLATLPRSRPDARLRAGPLHARNSARRTPGHRNSARRGRRAKSLFRRATFWDLLMEVVAGGGLVYAGYSYRDRADRFLRELTFAEAARLRAASSTVRFNTLRDQIGTLGVRAGGTAA